LSDLPENLLGGSIGWAGTILSWWVYVLNVLVAAYMVSYAMTAQTWVYLLLRRAADGTGLNECVVDAAATPPLPSEEPGDVTAEETPDSQVLDENEAHNGEGHG